MRFSNILLLLDSGSGHALALRRAVALARSEGAALTLCGVVNSIPARLQRKIVAITPSELTDIAITVEQERIEKLLGRIDASDIVTNIKVLVGKPHLEIAREVRLNRHDLVIKSITGRRALRSLSARREDKELLRNCPCPVWLVNTNDNKDSGCILAALDMPAEGTARGGLNEHIIEVATSIALAEFRELHFVHAWYLTGEGHMRSRGTAAANLEIDRMIAREATKRMMWLQDAVNASSSDSDRIATDFLAPELHVIKGSPKNVVPDLAHKLGTGLIIMGTAARTGVSGLWLGNTSEKVLSRSDCSFLIVKKPAHLSSPESGDRTPLGPENSPRDRGRVGHAPAYFKPSSL
ncbi:MAG TPA: universal stress protein [Woeseiaceae bacterium]|nr:universal stress protein [Woeseiaceae bacterium]